MSENVVPVGGLQSREELKLFEYIRAEYTTPVFKPKITLDYDNFTMNAACVRLFPESEYVQMLADQTKRRLLIWPCKQFDKDSVKWSLIKSGKPQSRNIKARMLCAKIHAKLATAEREQLAKRLLSSMRQSQSGESKAIRAKIREIENRISSITSNLKSLYEDKCAGKIPEAVFISLMGDFTKEQAEHEERLPQLRRELDNIQELTGEIEDWLSLVGSYMELDRLDRNIVTGLIESITVSERVKKDGKQIQELENEYRFIGNLLQNTKEDIA